MMSEIVIDFATLPAVMFVLRAYAFIIGLLMAGHFHAMINADRGYAPPLLQIIVTCCVGFGMYIAADAYFTVTNWSVLPAIVANVLIAFDLWIWSHGFIMADFVERRYRGLQ